MAIKTFFKSETDTLIGIDEEKGNFYAKQEGPWRKIEGQLAIEFWRFKLEKAKLMKLHEQMPSCPTKDALASLIKCTNDFRHGMSLRVIIETQNLLTHPTKDNFENYRNLANTLDQTSNRQKLLYTLMLVFAISLLVLALSLLCLTVAGISAGITLGLAPKLFLYIGEFTAVGSALAGFVLLPRRDKSDEARAGLKMFKNMDITLKNWEKDCLDLESNLSLEEDLPPTVVPPPTP